MSDFDINKFKEKEAFKVPKGYFEDFEARLEQRLHNEESGQEKKGKSIPLNILRFAAIASIFFLIFKVVGYFAFDAAINAYQNQNSQGTTASAEGSPHTDDLYYYYTSEMSDNELMAHQEYNITSAEPNDNETFEYLLATLDDYDLANHSNTK
ncbi:MAG: hypothetical protein ACK5MG_05425 [Bacteroidales bacterium]